MSLTKTVGLFAGTAIVLSGTTFASPDEANDSALQQIEKLKQEVEQLKAAQNGDNWLTEQRAAEIKGLVQDVLSDAETRASLQSTGATAGYDQGFFITSMDGNFRLNVNGGTQFRWTIDRRKDQSQSEDTTNWGFGWRHTQLAFSGHVVDPSWMYKVEIGFFDNTGDYTPYGNLASQVDSLSGGTLSSSTVQGIADNSYVGTAYLNDAWIMKDFGNGFYARFGQFKTPYSREYLLDQYKLQSVDRSDISYFYSLGRTQGIEGGYLADAFRVALCYGNGFGPTSPAQNSGGFYPPGNSPSNSFAIAGRAEVKLAGTWAQFEEEQSWRGEEMGLLLGIGGFWQSGTLYTNSYVDPMTMAVATDKFRDGDWYGVTGDITFEGGGWNVMASGYYQGNTSYDVMRVPMVVGAPSANSWGAVVQAGFFLTDDIELFARYQYGDLDGSIPSILCDTFNAVGVGFNWYFAKNSVKWQTDFQWAFQPIEYGAYAFPGNGWYEDNGKTDGQWNIRTQLSLAF